MSSARSLTNMMYDNWITVMRKMSEVKLKLTKINIAQNHEHTIAWYKFYFVESACNWFNQLTTDWWLIYVAKSANCWIMKSVCSSS